MPINTKLNFSGKQILITKDTVHVWLANIIQETRRIDYLLPFLSQEETAKARRFMFEKDRQSYIVSHSLLRILLSEYLQADPKEITFTKKQKNKPALDNHKDSDLYFNLSHSGEFVTFAISKKREVGIDIEQIRSFPDSDQIVQRFFSDDEINEYFQLPEDIKNRAFFTCWTRKEAFIKAIGEGLHMPLKAFSVSPNPAIKPHVEIHNHYRTDREWSIRDIELGDINYVSALAVEGNDYQLEFHNWNWD